MEILKGRMGLWFKYVLLAAPIRLCCCFSPLAGTAAQLLAGLSGKDKRAVLAAVQAPVLPQSPLSFHCGETGLAKLHGLWEVAGAARDRFRRAPWGAGWLVKGSLTALSPSSIPEDGHQCGW